MEKIKIWFGRGDRFGFCSKVSQSFSLPAPFTPFIKHSKSHQKQPNTRNLSRHALVFLVVSNGRKICRGWRWRKPTMYSIVQTVQTLYSIIVKKYFLVLFFLFASSELYLVKHLYKFCSNFKFLKVTNMFWHPPLTPPHLPLHSHTHTLVPLISFDFWNSCLVGQHSLYYVAYLTFAFCFKTY